MVELKKPSLKKLKSKIKAAVRLLKKEPLPAEEARAKAELHKAVLKKSLAEASKKKKSLRERILGATKRLTHLGKEKEEA